MPASGAPEVAGSARARRLLVTDLVVSRFERGQRSGRILDGVSLALEPGQTAAITGPSGAGKTTLLNAIAGLIAPDQGAVRWGDDDIASFSERERDRWRRDTVGLVFQDFHLIPELGVRSNILLPLSFDHWRTGAAARVQARKLAERVGLGDRTTRIGGLSRGEQQRVAVARALVRRPPLLLADEPTASLDPDNGKLIAELLISGAAETGASLLVVSHDRAVLDRVAQVFRLEAGRFVRAAGAAP